MNNRDFYRMMDSADTLNKKYGNNFGYKVILYTIVVSILFVIIVLGTQHIIKRKTSNEEFLLDSDSKYLISRELPKNSSYYEIDFSKGTVVNRHDTNFFKREKLANIKTDLNELKQFLLNITSDESNLVLTEAERQNLFKQHCHWIYKITNCENRSYYIKDVNQVKYLKKLLNESPDPFI